MSQNVISSLHGGRRKIPFVFSEQGVVGLFSKMHKSLVENILSSITNEG